MDQNTIDFIRDRFKSLETSMDEGFADVKQSITKNSEAHNVRLMSLEDTRKTQRTIISIGTGLASFVGATVAVIVNKYWKS